MLEVGKPGKRAAANKKRRLQRLSGVCLNCEKPFPPQARGGTERKFCSPACRWQAWQKQRVEKLTQKVSQKIGEIAEIIRVELVR